MSNNKYEDRIDFVTVIFKKYYNAKVLVDSIERYVDYPHKIYIVNNGQNEGEDNGYDILTKMFKDNKNVEVVKGVNQINMDDGKYVPGKSGEKYSQDYYIKNYGFDGFTKYAPKRQLGFASWLQTEGMTIGIKKGNGKYICNVEHDIAFLDKWTDDILPLLEDNVFVASLYRHDLNYARTDEWSVLKRETLENNYYKESEDLYPNCHFADTDGLISLWARENDKPFHVVENSLNDKSLKTKHVIDFPYGEECFINGRPFLHHSSRGSMRNEDVDQLWVDSVYRRLNDV